MLKQGKSSIATSSLYSTEHMLPCDNSEAENWVILSVHTLPLKSRHKKSSWLHFLPAVVIV